MNKIFLVSNEFIEKAKIDKKQITHKQLQKLCYYAEVWNYGIWNYTLTEDKFEAWRHGPVNRELFDYYKGSFDIINKYHTDKELSANEKLLISAIWDMYGKYNGDDLEQMSHKENPWINARQGLEDWEPSTTKLNEKDLLNLGKQLVKIYKENNLS